MISYTEAHRRVARARGVARGWRCVDCGGRAEEWSLRNSATDLQHEGVLAFSLNPEDYDPRCRSCHRKHDGDTKIVVPGERNPMATLSDFDVQRVRNSFAAGNSCATIARDFGVHPSTISRITRGVTRSSSSQN